LNQNLTQLYEAALARFGIEPQLIKCTEELSELQKELCKLILDVKIKNGSYVFPKNLEQIQAEIVDVELMIGQIKHAFQITEIIESLKMKKADLIQELFTKHPKVKDIIFNSKKGGHNESQT
jgi:recombinational DNA repair protein (RecF pathway)